MSVVGIDLGTTNTVVACVRGGKVHVLADETGNRLLPSIVSFHPNGEVLVGAQAKIRRVIDPKHTIANHKRIIGHSWNSPELVEARQRSPFELREGPGQGALVHVRGQDYTLPEVSAFVLKRARQIAETALGEAVERAVITVPAHFNELQRASTKVAGRISGVEVMRILNEPTAAALAYGLGRGGAERVCIYDFGGGTFDCTLLDLNGNVFEVLASAGDSFLGGDDADAAIADRMAEYILKTYRYDAKSDNQAFERLKVAGENVKIMLSTQEEAQVKLDDVGFGVGGAPLNVQFTLKRKDFEQLITPLVERSFKVTQDALALARLNPTSFDRVILVGGSTRIPIVRQRVEAFFGAKPMDKLNPDEVVAVGAAIQAAALVDAGRRREIPAPPALPGSAPKTMRGTGPGDDTESTLSKDAVTQGVPTQKKGTFPPGQRPIPGKSSQPPGKASQPPGKSSQVPGKMSQVPGRSSPPGMKQPSAPPKQGAEADDPSMASFPDLNVPSPFEWSQNAGTLTAQVDSKDLANQAGGRPDRTMATMNTMTANPRSVQTMNTVTADPRQQAPDPRRATGDIAAGNFGAMEEPPSLVSMVSSQQKAPAMPDDSPFGHASDLSLVSTTGVTQTQSFDLPGQKGGPIPRSDDEKPFGAVSDDLSLVSRAETSSPSIPSIPSIQERTAQLGGMPDPTGGEPGRKPGAPGGPTSQRTVQMQGSPPPAPRIEPFGQLKPNAPIARGEPSQPPKPPPPVPRGAPGAKPSDPPGQSPSQPPGFSGFGSNPPAAFTGFGSNPPPATAAPGPPQPPPPQAPVFSGFQQGGPLPQMPLGPGGGPMGGPMGAPPGPTLGGIGGPMAAPPGSATYNAPGFGGGSPFGGTTEPPFQGTELQQAANQLGGGAPVLVDVTPRALMIETAGGYCDTIIPRNSKIPCERTRKFSTSRDGQTVVRVRVAQGEAPKFMENTYLGEVELAGLRVAGRGDVTVAVSFELDADGTLKVRAWDTITLQEARATLQLIGIADESSVVMMINRFAQQPMAPPQ